MIQAQETRVKTEYDIKWEKLPDDFQLPDDPVENLHHPLLASALRELLELAGFITPNTLIGSNFGICATVNGKIVVKAPDWVYIPSVLPVPVGVIRRSYTPHTEGEVPAVVMEFLSDTESLIFNDELWKLNDESLILNNEFLMFDDEVLILND